MRWHTLAMTALAVLLAGAMAFAQDGPAGGGPRAGARDGGPRGDRMGQGQRGPGAQGGGLLEILNQLNLTDEQKQKLDEVKGDFDKKVAAAREKGGNPRDVYQGYIEEVKAVLNEEQLKKFNELNQQRGGMGGPGGRQPGAMIALALLGVAPQGMADLALTAEQQTKVQAIVKEFTDEVKKLQEKYQKQIRETLTPEQQTKFDKAVEEMKNRLAGGMAGGMGGGQMGGGPGGDRPQRPDRGNRPDRPARDGGAPQPPPKPEDKPVE